MDDVILATRIRGNVSMPVRREFSPVWTEEGLCFTYNTLNSDELYQTEYVYSYSITVMREHIHIFGHLSNSVTVPPIRHNRLATAHWHGSEQSASYTSADSTDDTYPVRAHSAGARGSLIVVLQLRTADADFMCRGPTAGGFKVAVHAPDEVPFVSRHFHRLAGNAETALAVRPSVQRTAEALRSYASERRRCFFAGERRLNYFRAYTQRNCELECVTDELVRKCGCTRFSMPSE